MYIWSSMPFMVILSKKFSRIWEKFWFVIFFIILDLLHHSSLDFFNIFQKKFWFVIVFFKWENLYTWILLCHSSWDFFNNTKVFERKFWCDIFWTREFVCLDAIPSQGNLGTVSELWNALSISEFSYHFLNNGSTASLQISLNNSKKNLLEFFLINIKIIMHIKLIVNCTK